MEEQLGYLLEDLYSSWGETYDTSKTSDIYNHYNGNVDYILEDLYKSKGKEITSDKIQGIKDHYNLVDIGTQEVVQPFEITPQLEAAYSTGKITVDDPSQVKIEEDKFWGSPYYKVTTPNEEFTFFNQEEANLFDRAVNFVHKGMTSFTAETSKFFASIPDAIANLGKQTLDEILPEGVPIVGPAGVMGVTDGDFEYHEIWDSKMGETFKKLVEDTAGIASSQRIDVQKARQRLSDKAPDWEKLLAVGTPASSAELANLFSDPESRRDMWKVLTSGETLDNFADVVGILGSFFVAGNVTGSAQFASSALNALSKTSAISKLGNASKILNKTGKIGDFMMGVETMSALEAEMEGTEVQHSTELAVYNHLAETELGLDQYNQLKESGELDLEIVAEAEARGEKAGIEAFNYNIQILRATNIIPAATVLGKFKPLATMSRRADRLQRAFPRATGLGKFVGSGVSEFTQEGMQTAISKYEEIKYATDVYNDWDGVKHSIWKGEGPARIFTEGMFRDFEVFEAGVLGFLSAGGMGGAGAVSDAARQVRYNKFKGTTSAQDFIGIKEAIGKDGKLDLRQYKSRLKDYADSVVDQALIEEGRRQKKKDVVHYGFNRAMGRLVYNGLSEDQSSDTIKNSVSQILDDHYQNKNELFQDVDGAKMSYDQFKNQKMAMVDLAIKTYEEANKVAESEKLSEPDKRDYFSNKLGSNWFGEAVTTTETLLNAIPEDKANKPLRKALQKDLDNYRVIKDKYDNVLGEITKVKNRKRTEKDIIVEEGLDKVNDKVNNGMDPKDAVDETVDEYEGTPKEQEEFANVLNDNLKNIQKEEKKKLLAELDADLALVEDVRSRDKIITKYSGTPIAEQAKKEATRIEANEYRQQKGTVKAIETTEVNNPVQEQQFIDELYDRYKYVREALTSREEAAIDKIFLGKVGDVGRNYIESFEELPTAHDRMLSKLDPENRDPIYIQSAMEFFGINTETAPQDTPEDIPEDTPNDTPKQDLQRLKNIENTYDSNVTDVNLDETLSSDQLFELNFQHNQLLARELVAYYNEYPEIDITPEQSAVRKYNEILNSSAATAVPFEGIVAERLRNDAFVRRDEETDPGTRSSHDPSFLVSDSAKSVGQKGRVVVTYNTPEGETKSDTFETDFSNIRDQFRFNNLVDKIINTYSAREDVSEILTVNPLLDQHYNSREGKGPRTVEQAEETERMLLSDIIKPNDPIYFKYDKNSPFNRGEVTKVNESNIEVLSVVYVKDNKVVPINTEGAKEYIISNLPSELTNGGVYNPLREAAFKNKDTSAILGETTVQDLIGYKNFSKDITNPLGRELEAFEVSNNDFYLATRQSHTTEGGEFIQGGDSIKGETANENTLAYSDVRPKELKHYTKKIQVGFIYMTVGGPGGKYMVKLRTKFMNEVPEVKDRVKKLLNAFHENVTMRGLEPSKAGKDLKAKLFELVRYRSYGSLVDYSTKTTDTSTANIRGGVGPGFGLNEDGFSIAINIEDINGNIIPEFTQKHILSRFKDKHPNLHTKVKGNLLRGLTAEELYDILDLDNRPVQVSHNRLRKEDRIGERSQIKDYNKYLQQVLTVDPMDPLTAPREIEFGGKSTMSYHHTPSVQVNTKEIKVYDEGISIPEKSFDDTIKEKRDRKSKRYKRGKNIKFKLGKVSPANVKSRKEGIKWFKERLEEMDIRVDQEQINKLYEIYEVGGKTIYGYFTKSAVILAEVADNVTARHEAFHVVFNLFLTPEQRRSVLNEVKSRYKEFSGKEGLPTMHAANLDVHLEELLADAFEEVQLEYGELPNYLRKGKVGKVLQSIYKFLFNNLQLLQQYITDSVTIEQLFYRLDNNLLGRNFLGDRRKKFKDIFKRNLDRVIDPKLRVAGWSSTQQLEYSNFIVMDVIDTILNNIHPDRKGSISFNEELEGLSPEERIAYINKVLSKIKPALEAYRRDFVDNNQDVTHLDEIIDNIEDSDFRARIERDILKYRGIKLGADNILDDPELADPESEDIPSTEKWQISYTSINPSKTMSSKLKEKMSSIRVRDRETGAPVLSIVNGTTADPVEPIFRYYKPDVIYNTLVNSLVDIHNPELFLSELQALSKKLPWVNDILADMQEEVGENNDIKDSSYFKHLYTATAAQTFKKFVAVTVSSDGNIGYVFKNRGRVNMLLTEAKNSFYVSKEVYNRDKESDRFSGKIGGLTPKEYKELAKNPTPKDIIKLFTPLGFRVNDAVALAEAYNKDVTKQGVKRGLAAINTVVENLSNDIDPYNNEANMKKLANLVLSTDVSFMQASVSNVEGKKIHSILQGNYISRTTAKLFNDTKNFVADRKNHVLHKDLPIYNTILKYVDISKKGNRTLKLFEPVILDGLTRTKTKYNHMNEHQMLLSEIGLFFGRLNTTRKADLVNLVEENIATYKLDHGEVLVNLGPLSDSPADYYVNVPYLDSRGVIVKGLVKTAKAEIERMKAVEIDGGTFVSTYGRKGTEFVILPSLNKHKKELLATETSEVLEEILTTLINEGLTKKWNVRLKQLTDTGILTKDKKTGKITTDYNFLRDGDLYSKDPAKAEGAINTLIEALQHQYYNQFYYNTQLFTLFGMDPAYYKDPVDFQKRYKEIHSPVSRYSGWSKPNYNALVLKDVKEKSNESIFNLVGKLFGKTKQKEYENNDLTDAGTYETLDRRVDLLKAKGDWPPIGSEKDIQWTKAIEELKEGRAMPSDNAISLILGPVKPFLYNTKTEGNYLVPNHMKNSQIVLLPYIAFQTTDGRVDVITKEDAQREGFTPNFDKYKNKKLAELLYFMHKHDADVAYFESANKVGRREGLEVDTNTWTNSLGYVDVLTFNNDAFGEQQVVPDKFYDARSLIASQIRKLIGEGIDKDKMISIKGYEDKISVKEAIDILEKDLQKDVQNNLEELLEEIDTPEGLRERLLQSIYNSNGSEVLIEAMEMEDGDFKLSLDFPTITKPIQQMINAMFNSAGKLKLPGGAYVNAPSFGLSWDLDIKVERGVIQYMEVMLPAQFKWMDKEKYKDEYGNIDINKLPEEDKVYLDGIVYRIPTEGKYSMFPIRVKGFLPPSSGGMIVMPREITTISGLDFDVDKVFALWKQRPLSNRQWILKNNPELRRSFGDQIAHIKNKREGSYKWYKPRIDKLQAKLPAGEVSGFTAVELKKIKGDLKDHLAELNKLLKPLKEYVNDYQASNDILQDFRESGADALIDKIDHLFMEDISNIVSEINEYEKQIEEINKQMNFVNYAFDQLSEMSEKFRSDEDTVAAKKEYDKYLKKANTRRDFFNKAIDGLYNKREEGIIDQIEKQKEEYSQYLDSIARINRRVDIMLSLLRTEESTKLMLEGGNKNVYAEARNELLEKKLIDGTTSREISDPVSVTKFKKDGIGGANLIGIYANAVSMMGLIEGRSNLSTTLPVEIDMDVTGAGIVALSNINILDPDVRGGSRMKNLQSGLFASTENAKDPFQPEMGITLDTGKYDTYMTALGMNTNLMTHLLNQPKLKQIIDRVRTLDDLFNLDVYVSTYIAHELERRDIDYEEYLASGQLVMSEKKLLAGTEDPLKVLINFVNIHEAANDFNALTLAIKIDGNIGPTLMDNLVFYDKLSRIERRVGKGKFKIYGALDILPQIFAPNPLEDKEDWSYSAGNIPQVDAFAKRFIDKVNFMRKYYPEFSEGFRNLLDILEKTILTEDSNWSRESAQMIKSAVTDIIAQDIGIEYGNIVDSFPKEFVKKRDEGGYSNLFRVIGIVEDPGSDLRVGVVSNLAYDRYSLDDVKEDFNRLYEEDPQFVDKLALYNILVWGIGFTNNSYTDLIPLDFWMDKETVGGQINEMIKDMSQYMLDRLGITENSGVGELGTLIDKILVNNPQVAQIIFDTTKEKEPTFDILSEAKINNRTVPSRIAITPEAAKMLFKTKEDGELVDYLYYTADVGRKFRQKILFKKDKTSPNGNEYYALESPAYKDYISAPKPLQGSVAKQQVQKQGEKISESSTDKIRDELDSGDMFKCKK